MRCKLISPMEKPDRTRSSVRARPRLLRALGDAGPPDRVEIGGCPYDRIRTFKHDSWAVTALYCGTESKMICKFNRCQPIFGLPMRWLGRLLASRESRAIRHLADVPEIPTGGGDVVADGQTLDHACAHQFIEGHPLSRNEQVNDLFFSRLQTTLATMHKRGYAYVDLNKRDNIIVGNDGIPYLVDFQIHFAAPTWQPAKILTWPLLRAFQRADNYHLLKHQFHHRRDQLIDSQAGLQRSRPLPIRLWRLISTPFQATRRRLLVLMRVRSGKGKVHTELHPPDGLSAGTPHLRK